MFIFKILYIMPTKTLFELENIGSRIDMQTMPAMTAGSTAVYWITQYRSTSNRATATVFVTV